MSAHQGQIPLRLWQSTHENGWEAWIAQMGDGTFTAWACLAGQNAVATYIEDSFDHACASAMFDLSRLSNHHSCGPNCISWRSGQHPMIRTVTTNQVLRTELDSGQRPEIVPSQDAGARPYGAVESRTDRQGMELNADGAQ